MPDPRSTAAPTTSAKICVACGEDCAGQARTKDPRGRYYHRACHERLAAEAARRTAASGAAAARASHPAPASPLHDILPPPGPAAASAAPLDEGPSFLDGLDLAPQAPPAPSVATGRTRHRPSLSGAGAAAGVAGDLLNRPWVFLAAPVLAGLVVGGLAFVAPSVAATAWLVVFGVLGIVWLIWFIKDAIDEGYIVVAVLSFVIPFVILYAIFARAGDGRMRNLWAGLVVGHLVSFAAMTAAALPAAIESADLQFGTPAGSFGSLDGGSAADSAFNENEYADGYDPANTPRFPEDDPRAGARGPGRPAAGSGFGG